MRSEASKSVDLEKFNFDAYDPSDALSPLGMDFVAQEKVIFLQLHAF